MLSEEFDTFHGKFPRKNAERLAKPCSQRLAQ
jgi:hypothetical protein